ncbi:mediator of RNA polymerase II transcription subunit 8 [Pseudocyphellaria aurata]|nr:mediator of RNA polymerase II transcription subunit 8 [Pseudocyphellaria aurata]
MATLSQQDLKILEQTRQRLSQLTNSLASLQQNILQSDPLPPWSSLQSHASIISNHLTSVSTHLSTHSALLASLAVFPLPSFPGKTQEPLLGQLLRKKLEPSIEDWVIKGQAIAEQEVGEETSRQDLTELWKWAGMEANGLARGHEWGGDFTREEFDGGLENVVTGLRRKLEWDEEDEDDEDNDDEEENKEGKKKEEPEDARNAMPLEPILKFLMTGSEPRT